jgi:hypothetical protein
MRIRSQSAAGGVAVLAALALLFAGINVPAVGIDDFASAVRGALGGSLEDLGLGSNFGDLSFLLNGGSALLSGILACFVLAKRRRKSSRDHGRRDSWRRSGPVMNGATGNTIKRI